MDIISASLIKILFSLAKIAVLSYAGLLALLYFFQDKVLFHPQPVRNTSPHLKQFEVDFTHDSATLHGWKLNPGKKNLLIYYGGNAEELSSYISDYNDLENYTTLLINYRGYGNSTGTPSEESIFKDALFIYDQAINEGYEKIILAGRSLGSGVAVFVASKRRTDGIILITPYDSIENVAKERYFMFPVGLLLKHKFDSLKYAKQVKCPTLMLIAENDYIVSRKRTDNLIKHWDSDLKQVVISDTDHNSLSSYPDYWKKIKAFTHKIEQ